jgi:hypothetical protein
MATLEIAPNGDSIIRVNDNELGLIVCALDQFRDALQKDPTATEMANEVIELLTVVHTR